MKKFKRECQFEWCSTGQMNCSTHMSWFNHLEMLWIKLMIFLDL